MQPSRHKREPSTINGRKFGCSKNVCLVWNRSWRTRLRVNASVAGVCEASSQRHERLNTGSLWKPRPSRGNYGERMSIPPPGPLMNFSRGAHRQSSWRLRSTSSLFVACALQTAYNKKGESRYALVRGSKCEQFGFCAAVPYSALAGYSNPTLIQVSPGQITTILVSGLRPDFSKPQVATTVPLPSTLAGVS